MENAARSRNMRLSSIVFIISHLFTIGSTYKVSTVVLAKYHNKWCVLLFPHPDGRIWGPPVGLARGTDVAPLKSLSEANAAKQVAMAAQLALGSEAAAAEVEAASAAVAAAAEAEKAAVDVLKLTTHNTISLKWFDQVDLKAGKSIFTSVHRSANGRFLDFFTASDAFSDEQLRGLASAMMEEVRLAGLAAQSAFPEENLVSPSGLALVTLNELRAAMAGPAWRGRYGLRERDNDREVEEREKGELNVVAGYQSPVQLFTTTTRAQRLNKSGLVAVKKLVLDEKFKERLGSYIKESNVFEEVMAQAHHPVDKDYDYCNNASVIILVKHEGRDCILLAREAAGNAVGTWSTLGGTSFYGEKKSRTAWREAGEESEEAISVDEKELETKAARIEFISPTSGKRKACRAHASFIIRAHSFTEGELRSMMEVKREREYLDPRTRSINGMMLADIHEVLEVSKKCQPSGGSVEKSANCMIHAIVGYWFNHLVDKHSEEGRLRRVHEGDEVSLRHVFAHSVSTHFGDYNEKINEVLKSGTVFVKKHFPPPIKIDDEEMKQ